MKLAESLKSQLHLIPPSTKLKEYNFILYFITLVFFATVGALDPIGH